MRRQSYKGEIDQVYALPVDAASTLGILIVLGSILPAKSLGTEALQSCKSILDSMNQDIPAHPLVAKLSDGGKLILEPLSNGKFALKDMKPMLKKIGINHARLGLNQTSI